MDAMVAEVGRQLHRPRPRRVFADMVLDHLPRRPTHAAIQGHLKRAMAIPEGSTGRRCIGRTTACKILLRIAELFADRPIRIAGSAAEFCAELGIHASPATLSAAMRLVCRATPLVRRADYRCWVIDMPALRALAYVDQRISALEDWTFGAAEEASEQTEMPFGEADGVAPEQPAESAKCRPVELSLSLRRACVVVRTQHSAAEENPSEPEEPGSLGGASPPPAEQAGASPASPPASDGDAPLREPLTLSGYLQALPRHRRQQQAVVLLRKHGPVDLGSTPRLAAQDLLRLRDSTGETRAYSREVEALSRALAVLRARGDLGEGFALPRFALHPWAVLLGIKARPSDSRPTAGQVRYLRARGIDPAGLSRPEAKSMQALLQLRKGEAMAWPRQMERFVAAHGWGERLARACAVGVIDDGLRGSIEHLRRLTMSAYFELMAARRSQRVH